jgi:hypothetical protein
MNQCERDLHEALRRREPPVGFEAKVLARTTAPHAPGTFSWRWLAVAASVLVIGGTVVIQEQRRAESEKAKEQLMIAFRITGSKVRDIQARLDSIQKRVVYPQLNP